MEPRHLNIINMLPHQDWNRITFSGPNNQRRGEQAVQDARRKGGAVESIRRNTNNSNRKQPVNMRVAAAEDGEVIPVAQLTHEFRVAMQKARTAAGLSQADLARRVNEKQSVINEYESGKAIPNPQIITKIERALNCRLPRPPKPQKPKDDD